MDTNDPALPIKLFPVGEPNGKWAVRPVIGDWKIIGTNSNPVVPFPVVDIGGATVVAAILQVFKGRVCAGIGSIRIVSKYFSFGVVCNAGVTDVDAGFYHFKTNIFPV